MVQAILIEQNQLNAIIQKKKNQSEKMRNHRKAMKEFKNLKKKDLSEMSSNEKSLFESFKEKEEKNKKRVAWKSMIESNVSSTSTSTTQHPIGMESTLTPTTGT